MISTTLYTWFKGWLVGRDDQGNKYYTERFYLYQPKSRRPCRWVVYKGLVEASKVPADWHAWLHYTADNVPDSKKIFRYPWQKEHLPNMSGTKWAYRPPAHTLQNIKKPPKNYEPWKQEAQNRNECTAKCD